MPESGRAKVWVNFVIRDNFLHINRLTIFFIINNVNNIFLTVNGNAGHDYNSLFPSVWWKKMQAIYLIWPTFISQQIVTCAWHLLAKSEDIVVYK